MYAYRLSIASFRSSLSEIAYSATSFSRSSIIPIAPVRLSFACLKSSKASSTLTISNSESWTTSMILSALFSIPLISGSGAGSAIAMSFRIPFASPSITIRWPVISSVASEISRVCSISSLDAFPTIAEVSTPDIPDGIFPELHPSRHMHSINTFFIHHLHRETKIHDEETHFKHLWLVCYDANENRLVVFASISSHQFANTVGRWVCLGSYGSTP